FPPWLLLYAARSIGVGRRHGAHPAHLAAVLPVLVQIVSAICTSRVVTSRSCSDRAPLHTEGLGSEVHNATECLAKDRNSLRPFKDCTAERGLHGRTTNGIKSVFATVRLRTDKTKGIETRVACLTVVFKPME